MDELHDPWYPIQDIDKLDTPALVIYTGRVDHNIRLLLSMIDDPSRLRPHVKTHKSVDATKRMMRAGIKKFKCATIAEAEMLGISGAEDVLLAYQPVGPKLERFSCLVRKYPATRFSCLTDNIAAAEEMSAAFESGQLNIPVFLDLNVGMNRTGILPGADAIALYQACDKLPGITPVGLHAYDGHIHDTNLESRRAVCEPAFDAVPRLKDALVKLGYPSPLIVAGGSPTFPIHAERGEVECSPGTFIYWDKGYLDSCQEQPFKPAALVVSRIISLPDSSKICIDLGHKSIAPENILGRRVYFLNAPGLLFVAQSEEHLVLDAGLGHSFKVGDVLYGLPYHVCPTIALYDRATTIEEGLISGEWKNAGRDRSLGC